MAKIKFKDLNWVVKIPIILSWIWIGMLGIALIYAMLYPLY